MKVSEVGNRETGLAGTIEPFPSIRRRISSGGCDDTLPGRNGGSRDRADFRSTSSPPFLEWFERPFLRFAFIAVYLFLRCAQRGPKEPPELRESVHQRDRRRTIR